MTLTIYLSGGMRGTWQDYVMDELGSDSFEFIDPRQNNQSNPAKYTPWDLFGIEQSDIVLCYMEEDNPSGHGLCVEAGYGIALNKHVITVIEPIGRKYWDFVRIAASVDFFHLEEAIDYIKSLVPISH